MTIEKDEAERTVEVPPEFAKLLKKEKLLPVFREAKLLPSKGILPLDH